jgi:hypothetical protein
VLAHPDTLHHTSATRTFSSYHTLVSAHTIDQADAVISLLTAFKLRALSPASRLQVLYCSAECQKAHWKGGGHKKVCKALQALVAANAPPSLASVGAAAARGDSTRAKKRTVPAAAASAPVHDADGRACIICLESNPPPIQSGCACRGDAGLAHVECRIAAAVHKQKSSGKVDGWEMCSTCKQRFHGMMGLGLAQELLRRSQGRPNQIRDWIIGVNLTTQALVQLSRIAEAERVCRESMSAMTKIGACDDLFLHLGLYQELAKVLIRREKNVEAHAIMQRCFDQSVRIRGPDHAATLDIGVELGRCLHILHKTADAAVIYRDILDKFKRASPPDFSSEAGCACLLAQSLSHIHKHGEALALFQEYVPKIKRVLGPDHIMHLQVVPGYVQALARVFRIKEAEVLLVEAVEAQKRVLGNKNALTIESLKLLATIRECPAYDILCGDS